MPISIFVVVVVCFPEDPKLHKSLADKGVKDYGMRKGELAAVGVSVKTKDSFTVFLLRFETIVSGLVRVVFCCLMLLYLLTVKVLKN